MGGSNKEVEWQRRLLSPGAPVGVRGSQRWGRHGRGGGGHCGEQQGRRWLDQLVTCSSAKGGYATIVASSFLATSMHIEDLDVCVWTRNTLPQATVRHAHGQPGPPTQACNPDTIWAGLGLNFSAQSPNKAQMRLNNHFN